ncbi:MAG: cob(I)yrinic acid a,c-diamide adenosyltransferase [Paludibacter sp.]|nr:cob(I)yrinic acid a,c-diamide adenosyltransferase [Paludibacter sp.]
MKIYTKTGDAGLTGLIGGTRVPKNDVRIEAYGTVDELNSFIGVLASYELVGDEAIFLEKIQHRLFAVGSHLATDTAKTNLNEASIVSDDDIRAIELEIDKLTQNLPPLTAFILPGGSTEGGICHVCRTVSRRAERRIMDVNEVHTIEKQIIMYMNRLSDYFFVLSRFITLKKGSKEILWKK